MRVQERMQRSGSTASPKQVNLRLKPDSLKVARVLALRAGVSLTRFLEGVVDERMSQLAENAARAAEEQARRYAREADELKVLAARKGSVASQPERSDEAR